MLRPYSQLTLLLGIDLDTAVDEVRRRGLQGAYHWALTYGQPEGLPRLDIASLEPSLHRDGCAGGTAPPPAHECAVVRVSTPSRSAMVRATLRMRWKARRGER